MHHIPRLVRWPLLAGLVVVLLAACSPGEDAASETEVAGVVLERGAEGQHGEEPDGDEADAEQAEGAPEDERPPGLSLLRSGPTNIGTVWLSAAGQWVGLDGQSLDLGDVPSPAHLNAIVEVDAGRAQLEGCELRLVAPEDAELEVAGEFTVEVVVEHASGEETRIPLDAFDLEVTLTPGDERILEVESARLVDLDADLDQQVHCEGRFDRT